MTVNQAIAAATSSSSSYESLAITDSAGDEADDITQQLAFDLFRAHYPTGWQHSRRLWNAASVVLFPIGMVRLLGRGVNSLAKGMILPSQDHPAFLNLTINELKEAKAQLIETYGEQRAIPVPITTADGEALDAMYFRGDGKALDDPTVIFFCGNGMSYTAMDYLVTLYCKAGFNLLMFDYRGVGADYAGTPRVSGRRLTLDGLACCEFVHTKLGVPQDKMILHGVSIGSLVAGEVLAEYPQAHYFSEMSGTSLRAIGERHFCGCTLAMIDGAGWRLNLTHNWDSCSGRKWVIYNPNDPLIHAEASVARWRMAEEANWPEDEKTAIREYRHRGHFCAALAENAELSAWHLEECRRAVNAA